MASTKSGKKPRSAKSSAPKTPGGSRPDQDGHSIPDLLFANVSPHSVGGLSMFDYDGPFDADIVSNFMSEDDVIRRAAQALQDAGFNVLQLTPYTINVAAPIATFERAFRTQVVASELPTLKSAGVEDTATYFSVADTDRFGLVRTQGTTFEHLIEGVAIETPRYYFATQPMAPLKAYWHLDVPAGVSLACNADRAHRGDITGRGIKVAMVDSGHFAHPFFAARGYRVQAVTVAPGAANGAADENGHGTAESANIFATAPDCELLPVKMSFANTLAAFNAAVGLSPDVITCSWGSSLRNGPLSPADQALAAAITDAVARGIVVVFSAGNGHWGFPGQHPDVISAGGVFRQPDGSLIASDYASGFVSNIYPGRNAPDLCGLVGMRPRAAYIMLPLQPGCTIDTGSAGGAHPNGDETAADDGWAAISGTSAAAPQLAGVAALIKQACARLTPAEVRDIMRRSAIDVTAGTCNPASSGAAAGPGFDVATGAGLVDAHAAVLMAKLRCLGPIRPIQPIRPVLPIQPIQPVQPVQPIRPVRPPVQPVQPVRPIRPVLPIQPVQPVPPPIGPDPLPPVQQDAPAAPESATGTLSAEDVRALEELVIQRRIDPLS
ncbi:MAG: Alkaline elastase YaB [Pseudomonadota bacterium]|jgi:hypothetical protein